MVSVEAVYRLESPQAAQHFLMALSAHLEEQEHPLAKGKNDGNHSTRDCSSPALD